MKKILITGITGYLGSNLAKKLIQQNFKVYGLVRQPVTQRYLTPELKKNVSFLIYDGTHQSVQQAFQEAMPDAVFHLAAYYTGLHDFDNMNKILDSNIKLGLYLLEAMSQVGCSNIIYAKSIMGYWTGESYCPLNLYAASKEAFTDFVKYYVDTGLIKAAAVILADTYGPGDKRPKVLNLIKEAIHNHTYIDLSLGNQIYDVVYIDDIIEGFLLAAKALEQAKSGHLDYQLSSYSDKSLRETVEYLVRREQVTLQANWGKRPEVPRQINQRMQIFPPPPGWVPRMSLEEGLHRFWIDK